MGIQGDISATVSYSRVERVLDYVKQHPAFNIANANYKTDSANTAPKFDINVSFSYAECTQDNLNKISGLVRQAQEPRLL